jgi:hypothetical protein
VVPWRRSSGSEFMEVLGEGGLLQRNLVVLADDLFIYEEDGGRVSGLTWVGDLGVATSPRT